MKDMSSLNYSRDKQLRKAEFLVSLVLQIGVVLSSVIIFSGLVLFFFQHAQTASFLNNSSYQQFTVSSFSYPNNFSQLLRSVLREQGVGFIVTGVLLLIITPILRVFTSILLFFTQGDIPMTIVTILVLTVLLGSFALGMLVK